MRLDKALVERGLCRSRGEAQAKIDAGEVTVAGVIAVKPSLDVAEGALLAVLDAGPRWVSRGALKLDAALTSFALDVKGRRALDVGASTGGFTEVLLARGAASVHAVDVGHGQMVPALASDPRVVSREGVNARTLTPADFPHPFGIIAADVSFISLTLILPALGPLLAEGGDLMCLVKPQFEVGPAHLGKNGIVRDPKARAAALLRVADVAQALGLSEMGRRDSPIAGGEGNVEFLLWLKASVLETV